MEQLFFTIPCKIIMVISFFQMEKLLIIIVTLRFANTPKMIDIIYSVAMRIMK